MAASLDISKEKMQAKEKIVAVHDAMVNRMVLNGIETVEEIAKLKVDVANRMMHVENNAAQKITEAEATMAWVEEKLQSRTQRFMVSNKGRSDG